jgi:hypothetical protein
VPGKNAFGTPEWACFQRRLSIETPVLFGTAAKLADYLDVRLGLHKRKAGLPCVSGVTPEREGVNTFLRIISVALVAKEQNEWGSAFIFPWRGCSCQIFSASFLVSRVFSLMKEQNNFRLRIRGESGRRDFRHGTEASRFWKQTSSSSLPASMFLHALLLPNGATV